ncbi:N-acetylmuramoyl-L-alanine amidase, partial [Candidatus Hakubella thermalkaliphila]
MTRESDVDVPLRRRLPALNAACFVSIHCNAWVDRAAHGTETFWRVGSNLGSRGLAEILQRHLLRELGLRDRGVKTASFQVLRQARC